MKNGDLHRWGMLGNPGPGGWGAVLLAGPHRKEISGYEPQTTNQRMELTAIIEALKAVKVKGGYNSIHRQRLCS